MSDIDYNKFSYKDYKRSRKGIKSKRGRVRYNFSNYDVYKNHITDTEKEIIMDNDNKLNNNKTQEEKNKEKNKENLDNDKDSNIEDLRTKKKPMRIINISSKKVNRKRDIIAVLMVVICFTLTIISADIISGGEIFDNLSDVLAKASGIPTYYAVEVGSYQDIQSAREASDLFRSRGAGGYVVNDGTYRVIAAIYNNKEDAKAIVEKLIADGLSGTIYEIKGAKVNFEQYGIIGNDIREAVEYSATLYDKLYDIGNSLDRQEITENQAKIEILTLYNETLTVKETFVSKTLNYTSNETVVKVRVELSAYTAILENLNDDKITRPSLLSDIRYSYIMIINSYCSLLKSIK